MNKIKYVLFFISLFITITPLVSYSQEGLRGSLSYTYEDRKTIDHLTNTVTDDSFFTQKYNLSWKKKYLLEKGALGILNTNFSLGYNVLDRSTNEQDYRVENFNNQWLINLLITPSKMPLYLELLTERSDVSGFDNNYNRTTYRFTHHMLSFKYVMPKYFHLYDPKHSGNGAGNGNGNGMFWGGNGNGNGIGFGGNGNGIFWGGNGNGGLLGGNGNGNGNGGFFNGNGGNGFGNGNGNGLLRRKLGPLVPYAYLFNIDSYITESNQALKGRYDVYSLNLGFLRFWINSYLKVDNTTRDFLIEFGQRKYNGNLMWTLLSNWMSASSYFSYKSIENNNVVTEEKYEGNFILKTYRSRWFSNLPAKVTYTEKRTDQLLELRLPYYFYGTTVSMDKFSGGLNYSFDKGMSSLNDDYSKNLITNNFNYSFRRANWKINSRHDIILLFDNIKNSYDYTTFNYRIDLNEIPDLNSKITQNASYELTLNKKFENDQKIYQVHSAGYGITYSGIDKMSITASDSLSYYDQGSITANSNDYVSQKKVIDPKIDPKGRSLRNNLSTGISYTPFSQLNLGASASFDNVFYESGSESKQTYRGMGTYTAIERMLTIVGDITYYNLDRLTDDDETAITYTARITYTPTYNLRSHTSYSYRKTELKNGESKDSYDESFTEEITYSYYTGKLAARKLFDVKAMAKYNNYKNNAGIVGDQFIGVMGGNVPKTSISYEGGLMVYPHRFLSLSGTVKKDFFKEDGGSYSENLIYTLNANVNFPLMSISAYYQEINKRIDANSDERRFNISVSKWF